MIKKRYQINYDLNHQNQIIINSFERKQTLPTILKKIVMNNPTIDEQVILAHILNIARENNIYFSKSQIRYCFNQFYNKEYHGTKKDYLAWLYSLQIALINLNDAMLKSKKAYFRAKKKQLMQNYIEDKRSDENGFLC